MISRENLEQILNESLSEEKKAERVCQQILEKIKANGLSQIIEGIKNDEAKHQILVQEMLNMMN
jgi:rubrerythrin